MIVNLLLSKCEYTSSLIKESIENNRDDETVIAYSANVLRYIRKYIDYYEGPKEDLEELSVQYHKVFNEYIEFQLKRMERVF